MLPGHTKGRDWPTDHGPEVECAKTFPKSHPLYHCFLASQTRLFPNKRQKITLIHPEEDYYTAKHISNTEFLRH